MRCIYYIPVLLECPVSPDFYYAQFEIKHLGWNTRWDAEFFQIGLVQEDTGLEYNDTFGDRDKEIGLYTKWVGYQQFTNEVSINTVEVAENVTLFKRGDIVGVGYAKKQVFFVINDKIVFKNEIDLDARWLQCVRKLHVSLQELK